MIAEVRRQIKAGNGDKIAYWATQLGWHVRGYDMESEWNASAQTGEKIRQGAQRMREKKAELRRRLGEWELWQSLAEEAAKRNPGLSISAAAEHVLHKLRRLRPRQRLPSNETIRKRIKKTW
jgi:hypothetical protein